MRFNELNQTYALLPFYMRTNVSQGEARRLFHCCMTLQEQCWLSFCRETFWLHAFVSGSGSVTRCSDIPGATMKMFGGSPWFYRKMSWFHRLTIDRLLQHTALMRSPSIPSLSFRPHRIVRRCGLLLVTDRVAWSVCRSVTLVSPAKMAEPIEMLFGLRTRVGPGNHVLDGVQIPTRRGNVGEKGRPL